MAQPGVMDLPLTLYDSMDADPSAQLTVDQRWAVYWEVDNSILC